MSGTTNWLRKVATPNEWRDSLGLSDYRAGDVRAEDALRDGRRSMLAWNGFFVTIP
jgi:hypothetical protein